MQIWIHYFPGSGGDGFCNLLEHAHKVVSLDGVYDWRVHRYVDNQVKFWSPVIDHHGTFRTDALFDTSSNRLTADYEKLVSANAPLVIASHLQNVSYLNSGHSPSLVNQNRISVWLYSEKTKAQCIELARIKNLIEYDSCAPNEDVQSKPVYPDPDQFHHVICIEQMQRDQTHFFNFLSQLGLTMDPQWYHQYLAMITPGHKVADTGVEHWVSYMADTVVKYRRLS